MTCDKCSFPSASNCITYEHVSGEDDIDRINTIQKLLQGGGGGTIFLPSPEYFGASTLAPGSGVIIKGCGSGRSTTGYGTRITSELQTVASLEGRACSIRDLNLHSHSADAVVVKANGLRETTLVDVWVTSEEGGTGVFIEGGEGSGSYVNSLVRVHTAGFDVGIHLFGNIAQGARRANSNSLDHCRTDSCQVGVLVEGCDTTALIKHHAEGCKDAGVRVSDSSIRTSLSQSYIENPGATDIDASGASVGGLGWVKMFACRYSSSIDPNSKIIEF